MKKLMFKPILALIVTIILLVSCDGCKNGKPDKNAYQQPYLLDNKKCECPCTDGYISGIEYQIINPNIQSVNQEYEEYIYNLGNLTFTYEKSITIPAKDTISLGCQKHQNNFYTRNFKLVY
ncbi:hypothetical protein QSE00_22545 [Arenibacter sp. M-2]|uniref:hypothetical protein n=1 Tax=Arenibacter sp. M-2 TaxID=3053612 RepID=UPI0025705625|nr:hypothetical protein [Arenibacter sp. M-2]MDL5514609.1 hypothetical protein [Arenibacter sp. M-2]